MLLRLRATQLAFPTVDQEVGGSKSTQLYQITPQKQQLTTALIGQSRSETMQALAERLRAAIKSTSLRILSTFAKRTLFIGWRTKLPASIS